MNLYLKIYLVVTLWIGFTLLLFTFNHALCAPTIYGEHVIDCTRYQPATAFSSLNILGANFWIAMTIFTFWVFKPEEETK